MRNTWFLGAGLICLAVSFAAADGGEDERVGTLERGRRLFEDATFNGNGRTCQTCHSSETGTVSPAEARRRFRKDPSDPLFIHDGSDDFLGNGVSRMLRDATVLVRVPLAANVKIADDPAARSVTVRRGIASTLNTPALDPVLMLDGRQPNLATQAASAIVDHALGQVPGASALGAIADFQRKAPRFFSSLALRRFAAGGAPAPGLPVGRTASERRGRRFFEDVPPDPAQGLKPGLCAHCHSGPLLNQTNQFAQFFIPSPAPIPAGQRFIGVGVSEFNRANNPVHDYVFNAGTPQEVHVSSPDIGRAAVTGVIDDPRLEHVNAFKISPLRGIRRTAPYFHDNSANTLEDVASHYAEFFNLVSNGFIQLTAQDEADMVAYMKLLD